MDDTAHDERPPARPGSTADLLRRMDRLELRQDGIERQVSGLILTVEHVELNQKHAEELNKLRFDSLDSSVRTLDARLGAFMDRIGGIISGEVRLPQNDAMLKDWRDWRTGVDQTLKEADSKIDEQAVLNGQIRLVARLAILLVTSNLAAVIAAIYAVSH